MSETLTPLLYPWYQIGKIENFREDKAKILQQGFLVFDCPIIDVSDNHSKKFASLTDGDEIDIIPDIKRIDLIIMTQSCDLANDKTEQVLLCGLTSSSSYNKNTLDNIRTNKMPALCLIEAFSEIERKVIDFRQTYTLPKEYVLEFIGDKIITGLLPPYREYVAQAFGRFFMRIGLPEELK